MSGPTRRLFLALAAAALTGCGGSAGTETITVGETVTEKKRIRGPSEPAPEPAPAQGGNGGAGADYEDSVSLDRFSTPSGNIGCAVGVVVRCDIAERAWQPPTRPARCNPDLDYGQGIALTENGATKFVCASDTTLGAEQVLPYGTASIIGPFVCVSEESGVSCTNDETGSGFLISRERYEFF